MIVLIDGDLVAYRNAAASEKEDVSIATHRCDELIRTILSHTGATSFEVYLSGSENFRKEFEGYKANRTQEPPRWLQQCREHIVTEWNASLSDGVEADDEIGMAATAYWEQDVPFIIASLDKDFLQLPGKHFRWATQGNTVRYNEDKTLKYSKPWSKEAEFIYMSPLQACQDFYKQMLIGDTADNVEGVMGIGEKKAAKAIDVLSEELDMYTLVKSLYNDDTRFERNAQLLWILKKARDPKEVLSHFHTLQKQPEETAS